MRTATSSRRRSEARPDPDREWFEEAHEAGAGLRRRGGRPDAVAEIVKRKGDRKLTVAAADRLKDMVRARWAALAEQAKAAEAEPVDPTSLTARSSPNWTRPTRGRSASRRSPPPTTPWSSPAKSARRSATAAWTTRRALRSSRPSVPASPRSARRRRHERQSPLTSPSGSRWPSSSPTPSSGSRADDLLPRATAEMPSGSRMPVMFGGKHAGWASMPEPSKKAAYVSDEKACWRWAREELPGQGGARHRGQGR